MSADVEWVLISLDEKMAKRQGLPAQLPVPKPEFEGLAEKGLSIDLSRKWIKDFLTNSEPGKSGAWRKKNSAIVASFEAFIDKAPLWDRAQKAFAERDYEKAISSLKRIASMDPDDHAARLNQASALANMGDHAGALKAFQGIRKTFEGDPDYHVAVGHVHIALKNRDAALDEMVLALEAKPDCQPALDAMVQLGVLVPIYENPKDASSLLYVRADAVFDYLAQQWDAEPRTPDFFLEQLAYHERELRFGVVLAAAERAIKAAGEAGSERAELARVAALRALGRVDESIAAARAYSEKKPASAGAHVELGKSLAAKGDADAARAELERALQIDPGDLNALMTRFWPQDPNDIAKIGEMVPSLEAFSKEHPDVPGVLRTLGRAYLPLGRIDDALDLFKRAVSLSPADDELRAEHWGELGKQQRYQEILDDAAKITDMNKRDWKLRWNEAEAYAGLGKKMEARAAFSAINFDESLHVDIRKRAKRAVSSIDEAPPEVSAPAEG